MRTWLKDWYGEELPRTDNIPLWLGGLKGEEFEREFFKEYEHHHADATEPIKECSSKVTHAEVARVVSENRSWATEASQAIATMELPMV
jgi:hypothetical protein